MPRLIDETVSKRIKLENLTTVYGALLPDGTIPAFSQKTETRMLRHYILGLNHLEATHVKRVGEGARQLQLEKRTRFKRSNFG